MEKIIETEAGYIDWDVYTDEAYDSEGNEVQGETYVKIDNLYIKLGFRGQGCAGALLTLAIASIRSSCPGLPIKIVAEPKDTSVSVEKLAHFYSSFGLEVVSV